MADAIVRSLNEYLVSEAYLRGSDEEAGGPVWECPECLSEAYVD